MLLHPFTPTDSPINANKSWHPAKSDSFYHENSPKIDSLLMIFPCMIVWVGRENTTFLGVSLCRLNLVLERIKTFLFSSHFPPFRRFRNAFRSSKRNEKKKKTFDGSRKHFCLPSRDSKIGLVGLVEKSFTSGSLYRNAFPEKSAQLPIALNLNNIVHHTSLLIFDGIVGVTNWQTRLCFVVVEARCNFSFW